MNCPSKIDREFELFIESEQQDSWPRTQYHLASQLYQTYSGKAFRWVFDRLIAAKDSETFHSYRDVFHGLAVSCDGFPEHFLKNMIAFVKDGSRTSLELRGAVFDGVLHKFPVSRNEKVFKRMTELCRVALASTTVRERRDHFRNDPTWCLMRLSQRRYIIERFEQGDIFIPESLLSTVISGKTWASQRFLAMGYNEAKLPILCRILRNIWGMHGPWDFSDRGVLPNSLVHSERFPAVSKMFTMVLTVEWEKDIHGNFLAKRLCPLDSEMQNKEIKEHWCEAY